MIDWTIYFTIMFALFTYYLITLPVQHNVIKKMIKNLYDEIERERIIRRMNN